MYLLKSPLEAIHTSLFYSALLKRQQTTSMQKQVLLSPEINVAGHVTIPTEIYTVLGHC